MADNFPELVDTRGLRFAIDDGFSWVVANYGDTLERLLGPLLKLLGAMEAFLQWLPWYVTIAGIALLTYSASRNLRMTGSAAVMLFFIGAVGLWNDAMATVALMLAATVVAVVVGIPLGILMARSDWLRSVALPLLNIMQTLPIFVYLIPFVMLFGPGKIPAILATVFFAIPPVIRLTDLGIRQVDGEVVEAIVAFGATPSQKLVKVQIPLAMPTIMAGINQTTMMALSMVVIASMIGAGGLGYQVLQGIQRLEVSRGLVAGIAIVTVSDVKIQVDKVYKIFGSRPDDAMAALQAGAGKADVLQKTGCIVGLKGIDFSIRRGETFVIMGLSGSGKSTLIRHFNRLIEPTSGRILVDGRNIMDMNAGELLAFRRTGISMVFQRFGLLPHQTVLENTICGPVLQGVDRREARARGMEQLELVGLKGFENRFPRQLSGGMQQRVGLARALATQADVLLMDEAFSALAPLIKSDMQEQLKEIQARLKKTIIFITHDLDEALHLGDRIAILKDGELRQVGTGEEILFRPADDYVERFVRKVDLSRALYAHDAFAKVPILTQAEATGGRTAALLREHPAVIVAHGEEMHILTSIEPDRARQVASIDATTMLGQSFPLLAGQEAVVIMDSGAPAGILTREMAFKALSRSARAA